MSSQKRKKTDKKKDILIITKNQANKNNIKKVNN